MAGLRFDRSKLDELIKKMEDPSIKEALNRLPQMAGVAAIVAQAIADNFRKEGPGWAPLQADTIRKSVAKKLKKELAKMSNAEILEYERKARIKGTQEAFIGPNRMILQKTGALKKSVTTPGGQHNIWTNEGTKLVWGTDLVYAGVHNYGWPAKNIPKREFLVIRDEWMKKLNNYLAEQIFKIVMERWITEP